MVLEDRVAFQAGIDEIQGTTEAILERLDYRTDNEDKHRDSIEAICILAKSVLILAEIQLYR